MPHDPEVVGSNPGGLTFLVAYLFIHGLSLNKSLKEVQHYKFFHKKLA